MNTRNIRFKTNRVRDILERFHEELDILYGAGEVRTFAEMLCEAFLGWDRVRLLTSKEQTINQSDLLRFHWALEDLKRYRPIQHIIGYVDFCGCRLEVTPDVLIPRPETAELVQWTLDNSTPRLTTRILDLCTGSGCIAIALKKALPHACVTAVDISPAALEVARRNAAANEAEVQFVEADILDNGCRLPAAGCQLIVGNPPYVLERERPMMRPNVLDYEPHSALFVPDSDPLRFYHAIAAIARQRLAPGGMLVVEINEGLADATCALLNAAGFLPTPHHDFRSKVRFLSATR